MSVVTGIMLICCLSDADDAPLADIRAWLASREYAVGAYELKDVADFAGGSKHPQFAAFSAGCNYFDCHGAETDDGNGTEEFAAFVLSRAWNAPENVVLIMQPEEGETRVFRPAIAMETHRAIDAEGGVVEKP
jgi:hypothetical protein